MYTAHNLYSARVFFIDLDDRDFFTHCLKTAISRQPDIEDAGFSDDYIKKHTPVIFASTLSKHDKIKDAVITRKDVNTSRARRKFLMIDADFEPGQESESELMRERLVKLASRLKTPLMIYPTVSFPDKPRFRAVLLSKRAMSSDAYFQGMSWLYDALDMSPLDDSDLRMSANRNAPIFKSDEQVDAIYSTFEDDDLSPLDNKLWSSYPKPKTRTKTSDYTQVVSDFSDSDIKLEPSEVKRAMKNVINGPLAESRGSSWFFIESVGAAVVTGVIDEKLAYDIVSMLASRAESDELRHKWEAGNIEMLEDAINDMPGSPSRASKAKPLFLYREMLGAIK